MNLLLIDSTQPQLLVGRVVDGQFAQQAVGRELRQHDKVLSSLVKSLGSFDYQAVAVVVGPGSWTGIRVGLAAAKAYAYAWGVPLICLTGTPDPAEATRKFHAGEFTDPFAAHPVYGGEFFVTPPKPR